MSRNMLAMSEFPAAILDFKMTTKCFTLLCISLIIALWKENKDSLHLRKCLLSGNCHHMAAISEFKMATTLLDMPFSMIYRCRLPCRLSLRKLLYRHFARMAAIFNFPMTAALPVLFSVIEHEWMNEWIYLFQQQEQLHSTVYSALLITNCWKEGNKKYNTYSDYPQY